MRNKYLLIITIAFLTAILTSCTDTTSGGETLNEKIALYMPDGITPAVDATIKFFSIGDTSATPIHQTQTDAEGKYSTSGVTSTGYYNVIAEYEDSLYSMQDTVFISQETNSVKDDTLNNPGSISGIVALQPNHLHLLNNVYVIALGMGRAVNVDSTGWFTMTKLAPGDYNLQVDTDIKNYGPKFVDITITTNVHDTISDTIILPYSGIPVVTGLTHTYDTLNGIVTLYWSPSNYGDISNYLIYRKSLDSLEWPETQLAWISSTDSTFQDTIFHGGTVDDTDTYNFDYCVVIMDNGSNKGPKYKYTSVQAISPLKVTTTIKTKVYNKVTSLQTDTLSPYDTAQIILDAYNSFRPYKSITWSLNHPDSIIKQSQCDTTLPTTNDTLNYYCTANGNYKIYTKVQDMCDTVWIDSTLFSVWNIPDSVPLYIDSIFGFSAYLKWNKSLCSEFKSYKISYSTSSIFNDSQYVLIENINDTTFKKEYLIPNTNYHFKINVINNSDIQSTQTDIHAKTSQAISELPVMNTGIMMHTTTVFNDKIYLFGGMTGSSSIYKGLKTNVEEFDPANNSWTLKCELPRKIQSSSSTLLNNEIFIIGGMCDTGKITNEVNAYNPNTNSFRNITFLNNTRVYHSSVNYKGNIFVFGGSNDSLSRMTSVEMYDPQSKTWTHKKEMPTGRSYCSAIVCNNKIWVIGGSNSSDVIEIYDPVLDSWQEGISLVSDDPSPGVIALNNKIYAFYSYPNLVIKKFTAQSNELNNILTSNKIYFSNSTTLNHVNGLIYLIGGSRNGWPSNEMYLFNPK